MMNVTEYYSNVWEINISEPFGNNLLARVPSAVRQYIHFEIQSVCHDYVTGRPERYERTISLNWLSVISPNR